MKNIDAAQSDAGEIYKDGTYLENNSTWHVEDSPWKARQISRLFLRNNIVPRSVCEVGCGAGELLVQLSKQYPTASFCGYELSPQAYEFCKARSGGRVQYKNLSVFSDEVFFQVLLCIDVFEHVEDYIGFVRALKSKAELKVFHVPLDISVLAVLRDSQITARNSVGHLHYFTPATAIATLVDAGYQIVDSFFTAPFDELPGRTLKSNFAKIPRKILYAISPRLAAKFLGGCSLIVLAR